MIKAIVGNRINCKTDIASQLRSDFWIRIPVK